jgi:hypothetical protein
MTSSLTSAVTLREIPTAQTDACRVSGVDQ